MDIDVECVCLGFLSLAAQVQQYLGEYDVEMTAKEKELQNEKAVYAEVKQQLSDMEAAYKELREEAEIYAEKTRKLQVRAGRFCSPLFFGFQLHVQLPPPTNPPRSFCVAHGCTHTRTLQEFLPPGCGAAKDPLK
jgi:8-oxo-dGTP pyrophosphatase MutT (NUDIX family)